MTIHLHHYTHLLPKLQCSQATENEECMGTQTLNAEICKH